MLKKLLRYDLKSVFRYWWIAALASIGLSVVLGFAISIAMTGKYVPPIIEVLDVLTIIFAVIGIVVFPLFAQIMMYVRYYKNFFTDEGYLTFTLPVKCSQLLSSKLITSIITTISSVAVILLDIRIVIAICVGEAYYEGFLQPLWRELSEIFAQMSALDYVYMFTIIIEVLLVIIMFFVFSTLLIFACITFAAIITKKAKVITAIGVYYIINGVITGAMQLIFIFGIGTITERLSTLVDNLVTPVVIVILLTVILLLVLVCMILYLVNHFMIDRKLNLA